MSEHWFWFLGQLWLTKLTDCEKHAPLSSDIKHPNYLTVFISHSEQHALSEHCALCSERMMSTRLCHTQPAFHLALVSQPLLVKL